MPHHPKIGSKWVDPTLECPYLRTLPRGWTLEETRRAIKTPWYQRTDRWAALLVALLLLMACAQAAIHVIKVPQG